MNHVVLLGDSIFDNAGYVPGRPPVVEQLAAALPRGWRATLLAVDGATTAGVARQLARLPAEAPGATHLFVSVGGNDALMNGSIARDTRPAVAAFRRLAEIQRGFRGNYRDMLDGVLAAGLPTAVCTVYDAVPGLAAHEVTLLSVFNDVIVTEAARSGVPVLDLRVVCDEARDYSERSPIEPSEVGGAKIADGIRRVVTGHDFGRRACAVYGK